jgi:hypothetical protein
MIMNVAEFLFVGGVLDGQTVMVDERQSDVYKEVFPKNENLPLSESVAVDDRPISYTVQHYRKCFKFDGVKRTDYFELVT